MTEVRQKIEAARARIQSAQASNTPPDLRAFLESLNETPLRLRPPQMPGELAPSEASAKPGPDPSGNR